jgi:large subunit ribosomal protein L19
LNDAPADHEVRGEPGADGAAHEIRRRPQMERIRQFEQKRMKESLPQFEVGDSVDVEVRIQEGEKERIQIFSGLIIAIRGTGLRKMITVRRIVQSEGVERIFPIHSPKIAGIHVKRKGRVRRSKLYYLRGRTGKSARITERRVGLEGGEDKA